MTSPAAAQIKMLDPFAAPQGSVAPLLTTSADTCSSPAPGAATAQWGVYKVKMANGLAWNNQSLDTVCFGTNYLKFVLRDTAYYHGPNDPSFKRRAEIGIHIDYRNGATYTQEYDFQVDVAGLNTADGNTLDQFQDPHGGSPSISHRQVWCGTKSASHACLITTTRYDDVGGGTVKRGQVPLTFGVRHHLKTVFRMGGSGFEQTYLDGALVSSYTGPIGTTTGDGYDMRFGSYGAPLNGEAITQQYWNIALGK